MPLFDYLCLDCTQLFETLVTGTDDEVTCTHCGSRNLRKMLSAHSSYSGATSSRMPGAGDTACCGSSPDQAGCAGPGSCCGKH